MSSALTSRPQLVESLADLAATDVGPRLAVALGRADLVELRLDRLPAGVLGEVPPDARSRVLATCRAAWEGGAYRGTEEARHAVLRDALDAGVGYVDVEFRASFRRAIVEQQRARTVVSLHDFTAMPPDLAETLAAMADERPAVVKVAVTATRLSDVIALREAGRGIATQPRVLIAMGQAGVATRVMPGHFGSCWTYAGDGVAPGQVAADRLRDVYRLGEISAEAQVLGVAGRPIGHSLSPVLHNAALAARGLDAVYVPLEAADIDDLLHAAEALGVRGLSVTAPFKHDALARATAADPATVRIGAANTLTRAADGWHATNTDVEGFLAPLRARRAIRGARVAVLGAGGAARAVVHGLAAEGADVTVYARRPEQATSVAAPGASTGVWPPDAGSWDVLVNTTPVGTAPDVDRSPLSAAALGSRLDGRLVYDLVYNPARTRLLTDAAERGALTLGGLDMLVAQAARQFEIWHGGAPPIDIMRAAVARHATHLVPHVEAACPD